MRIFVFSLCVCVLISQIQSENSNSNYVEEVFYWKGINYENLPHPDNYMVGPFNYLIPGNQDVGSIGYHPASGLMVVNIVRIRPGIPTSVGAFCLSDYKHGSSPTIWGFPNYELNELVASDFDSAGDERRKAHKPNKGDYYGSSHGNHHYVVPSYYSPTYVVEKPNEIKRIISVFHITVDEKCNRLFFLDNGELSYVYDNLTYHIQNPSLWVMELPENGCQTRNFPIIRRRELPDRIAARGSNGFMTVNLDYQSNDCDDLFLYITNAFSSYLTVYHYKKDEFWAFEHETMKPVIAESHLLFRNYFHYQMELGIFALVLGPRDEYGDRTAYYSSIASTAQYAVSTKVLKDRRKSPENYNADDFRIFGYRGWNHQPLSSVIDYTTEVIFTTDVQTNEVHCWNINKPLNPDNIGLIYKSDKYFFGPEIIVDSRGYLWFIASSIPFKFGSDQPLDLNQVNSRIFRVKVTDAIRETVCENVNEL